MPKRRYMKTSDIRSYYDISWKVMNRMLSEMLACGRYPPGTVIGYRQSKRVDADAFQDYYENLELLRNANSLRYMNKHRPYKGGK